jgi:filamentous hemagglutinin family protein
MQGTKLHNRQNLLLTTALTGVALLTVLLPRAYAQGLPPPNARPTGGVVAQGQATFGGNAGTTLIDQTSQNAVINWQTYNVGSAQTVQYVQPNASSITLNRVLSSDPSVIAGRITANGQIVLVNQSGVVFTRGSQVDTAGLVVSAANITDQNFMAGKMVFNGAPNAGAAISNAGNITIRQAGLAALVAPQVSNSGTITAQLGRVVLGGAATSTLDLYGDGLMALNVTGQVTKASLGGKTVSALVTNTGTILAPGGTVVLSAAAVDGVVTNLVSAGGTIAAPSVGNQTGRILVQGVGGGVTIDGTVAATGVATGTTGGQVVVDATGAVTLTQNARMDASGDSGGGLIAIGTTAARAAGGPGVASAMTAQSVSIAAGATVHADATRTGHGGRIAVLSRGLTRHAGLTSAQGAGGGKGGWVEISGATLDLGGGVIDAGKSGTILLDPQNLVIGNNTGNTANTTDLSTGFVDALTGNIILQADGTLVVADPLALNAAATSLELRGDLGVFVNAGISGGSASGLDVYLVSLNGGVFESAGISASLIAAKAGGDILLTGNNTAAKIGAYAVSGNLSGLVVSDQYPAGIPPTAQNDYAAAGISTGGNLSFTDTSALVVDSAVSGADISLTGAGVSVAAGASVVSTTNGTLGIFAETGNIQIAGAVGNNTTSAILLDAAQGNVTEAASGGVTAPLLAANAGGGIALGSTGNAVGAIGGITVSSVTVNGLIASGGDVTFTDAASLAVNSRIAGGNISVTAAGIDVAQGVSVGSTANGTIGIVASTGNIQIAGSLGNGTTAAILLDAVQGDVSEAASGVIVAPLFAASAGGSLALGSAANDIGAIGSITAAGVTVSGMSANGSGGIVLVDSAPLTIAADATAQTIAITTPALTIAAAGALQLGTLSSNTFTATPGGFASLVANAFIFDGTITGDTNPRDSKQSLVALDVLSGTLFTVQGGATVDAASLENITAGTLALGTANGTGAGNTGDLEIDAAVSLASVGTLGLFSGNVINASAGITVGALYGSVGGPQAPSGTVSLLGSNDIGTLASFSTDGKTVSDAFAFYLDDAPSSGVLTVVGPVTATNGAVYIDTESALVLGAGAGIGNVTGTDVFLNAAAGNLTQNSGAVDATGVPSGSAGTVVLAAYGDMTLAGAVTSGAAADGHYPGAILLSAGDQGAGVAGDITETGSGVIGAGTLAASANGSILLASAGNTIGTIAALAYAPFSVSSPGLFAVGAGGITLADTASLTLADGAIAEDFSGAIAITSSGALTLGTSAGATLTATGITLTAADDITQTGGTISALSGDAVLTAGVTTGDITQTGIIEASGTIGLIATAGSISIGGTLGGQAGGQADAVLLDAAGDIAENGTGVVVGSLLAASAGGSIVLASASNAIGTIAAVTSGQLTVDGLSGSAISLADAQSLLAEAPITATSTIGITISGEQTTLTVDSGVTAPTITIIAPTLTVMAGGALQLGTLTSNTFTATQNGYAELVSNSFTFTGPVIGDTQQSLVALDVLTGTLFSVSTGSGATIDAASLQTITAGTLALGTVNGNSAGATGDLELAVPVVLTTVGSLGLFSTNVINATGGITLADGVLYGSAGGSQAPAGTASIVGNNDIATLASFSTDSASVSDAVAFTFVDAPSTGSLTVAGPVLVANGAASIDVTGGGLVLGTGGTTGDITATDVYLQAAGFVTQVSGTVSATGVVGTSSGTLAIAAGNGAVSVGGSLIAGAANGSYDGAILLSATGGDISESGGVVAAGTLAAFASGNVSLDSSVNSIGTIAALTLDSNGLNLSLEGLVAGGTSGIALVNAPSLTVADGAVVSASAGTVAITVRGGGLTIGATPAVGATVFAQSGIDLMASRGITLTGGSVTANGGAISATVTDDGDFVQTSNIISETGGDVAVDAEVGNVTQTNGTISASGNATLIAALDFSQDSAVLSAGQAATVTAGEDISQTASAIDAGADAIVTATSGSITQAQASVINAGGNASVTAGGDIDQTSSTITATANATVSAGAAGAGSLNQTTGLIGAGGIATVSSAEDIDQTDSTISGGTADVTAGAALIQTASFITAGGDATVTAGGDIEQSFSTIAAGGDAVVYAGTDIDQSGSVVSAGQNATVTANTGSLSQLAAQGTASTISAGGNAVVSAGTEIIQSSSAISAGTTATVTALGGGISQTASSIAASGGDAILWSGGSFTQDGASSVSATGTIGIFAANAISAGGTLGGFDGAPAQAVLLKADGQDISVTGTIAAALLAAAAAGSIALATAANAIGSVAPDSFTANGTLYPLAGLVASGAGGITLTDGIALLVADDTQVSASNGALNITVLSGGLTIGTTTTLGATVFGQSGIDLTAANGITLTGGSVIANGGAITATVTGDGDFVQNANTLSETGGDVTINAEAGNVTQTGGTINASGNATILAALDIGQTGSTISAGEAATVLAGGDIAQSGSAIDAGSNATVTATSGSLTQAQASVISAGGDATVAAGGDIDQSSSTMTATANATVSAGTAGTGSVNQTASLIGAGGNASVTAASDIVQLAASTISAGQAVTVLAGGNIAQTGSAIDAGTNATVTATSGSLTQAQASVISALGDAGVYAGTDVDQSGSVIAAGQNATVTANAGNISQTASSIAANGGNAILWSGASFTQDGASSVSAAGTVGIYAAGAIAAGGAVGGINNAKGQAVLLDALGSISVTGTIDATILAASAGGSISATTASNAIGTITGGIFIANSNMYSLAGLTASGGGIALADADTLTVADGATINADGALSLTAGANQSLVLGQRTGATIEAAGAITLTAGGAITQNGGVITINPADGQGAIALSAANGDITQSGGGIIAGTLTASGAPTGSISLTAVNGNILQNGGTLVAGTLSGTAFGTIALGDLTNEIATVAALAARGGVTLGDSVSLTLVDNGSITTSAGNILVTETAGSLTVAASALIDASAGGVTLVAQQGPMVLAGTVTAGQTMSLSGDTITQSAGTLSAGGDAGFVANGAMSLGGTVTVGGTLALQAASIDQTGGSMSSGALSATAGTVIEQASGAAMRSSGGILLTTPSGTIDLAGVVDGGTLLDLNAGAITVAAGGTLATTSGDISLTANTMALGGTLSAGNDLDAQVGDTIAVTGNLSAAQNLIVNASNSIAAAAGSTLDAAAGNMTLTAGTITLGGQVLAAQDIVATASDALTVLDGSLIRTNAAVANEPPPTVDLFAPNIVFAGDISAPAIVMAGAAGTNTTAPSQAGSVTWDGGVILTGQNTLHGQALGNGHVALPFISGPGLLVRAAQFAQIGTTVIAGYSTGAPTVEIATSGTALLGTLDMPSGDLLLDLRGGGVARMEPDSAFTVAGLTVYFTGGLPNGGANLAGIVDGKGGIGAAAVSIPGDATQTKAVAQTGDLRFQINACAVGSLNCVLLSPQQALPVVNPVFDLIIPSALPPGGEDELLPNVPVEDY